MPGEPGAPKKRFGSYEILARIGRGGMGDVFRARVLEGPREGWLVALKRLLPELSQDPVSVDRFTAEAELARQLEHPNIVRVYEAGLHDGTYYMVMDLVDGRDLFGILSRCQKAGIQLPVDFGVFLAQTLLRALDYAHHASGQNGKALGLVHCDVSPSNLFISRSGEVKLGDFGVARARRTSDEELTSLGKPHYFSSEAFEGAVTTQLDLWATAVTLYETLTLARPFEGKTAREVYLAAKSGQYLPAQRRRADIPQALDEIFERAFQLDPERRFPSAAAFAEALTPHYDERVGTPLALAGVVRGLFGARPRGP
jgi:serine/threonine-protein kinase